MNTILIPNGGGLNIAQVQSPSLTIMNGDSASGSPWSHTDGGALNAANNATSGLGGPAVSDYANGTGWEPGNTVGDRHLEGANYAFCDGHVKWLKPTNITRDGTSTGNFTFRISPNVTDYP
jgi:prepilin-type processing-associated H-X9-DG protein